MAEREPNDGPPSTSGAVRLVSAPSVGSGRGTAINTYGGLICQPNVSVSHPLRTGPAVVVNAEAALVGVAESLQTPAALQRARRYGTNASALVSVSPALFFRRGPVPHQLKADVRIWIRSAVAAVAPN